MFAKKKELKFLGFSVMELVVSFVIIAILAGVTTPILFKKSTKTKLKGLSSITTKCDIDNASCKTFLDNPDDINTNRCQLFKKRVENGQVVYTCALCKPSVVNACTNSNQYFDKTTCKCGFCSEFDSKVNPTCADCCIRCNSQYCTGCAKGVGLKDRTIEMGCEVCEKGTYSDNSDGVAEACKLCPAGYYCPEDRQTDGKKYKCPVGYYCPEGTKDYKDYPCPAGYYCPDEGMTDGKKYKCPAGCACPSTMGKLSENLSMTEVGRTLKCPMKVDDGNKTYPCAKNYYCPEGTESTTKNSCDSWRRFSVTKFKGAAGTSYCECKEGYYLLNGSCSRCADGTYKAHIGNDTYCTDCPAGSYCPSITEGPKSCGCGTYSTGKATFCTNSGAGYYTPLNNGVYTYRQACSSGTYTTSNANCSCTGTCPNGTYATGTTGCASQNCACAPCYGYGLGCASCIGGGVNDCTSCVAGQALLAPDAAGNYQYAYIGRCFRRPVSDYDCSINTGFSSVYASQAGGACIGTNNKTGGVAGVASVLTNTACAGACCASSNSTEPYYTSTPGKCTTTDTGGYTGCSRTLCNRAAAEILCKIGDVRFRLPYHSELAGYNYAAGWTTMRYCIRKKGSSSTDTYYGISYCPDSSNARCFGTTCHPAYIHTVEGFFYMNSSGGSGSAGADGSAASTRCAQQWVPAY